MLPKRKRGRQSAEADGQYQEALAAFCATVQQINSTLDFRVSSRGWAYIFENRGVITKTDLDACQRLINDCRKSGALPLDICSEDETRAFDNVEYVANVSPADMAQVLMRQVEKAHQDYTPTSYWENQDYYVQMLVEKIDLKSLFTSVCNQFNVPIANGKGWGDINLRVEMMRRFEEWESEGKQCVLLYCGDHDPAGLHISDFLRSNMADLADAVGWSPDDIIIDRFGLNADFIEAHDLTWIDNLITKSGICLSSPRHHDHVKPYVQSYIAKYGVRKVEANALVVAPEAGRDICRAAILQYINLDAADEYRAEIGRDREAMRIAIVELMGGADG